jgi:chemotaxis protein MotB
MADQQPIIIIRRKKKGGGEGHHGGAWKVAYADFVTAMMAFFLLLWLLNVTTDEQRHGIADYFTPASIARSESGAGGMMGGQSISAPGAMTTQGSPPIMHPRTIPSAGQGEEGSEDTVGKSDHGTSGKESGQTAKTGKEPTTGGATGQEQAKEAGQTAAGQTVAGKSAAEQAAQAEQAQREVVENARFARAAEQLKQAIQQTPALQGLADQLLIDQTPEGLRIQIIDKDNSSMFPSGSAILYEKSRELLALMGRVMARLPNNLTIAGHTDGAPFSAGARRDNWMLSTERANVCRRALEEAGVEARRIARVIGMADREPLDENPNAAKNRRISITLLRQNPPPEESPKALPAPLPAAVPALTPAVRSGPLLPSVLPDDEPIP